MNLIEKKFLEESEKEWNEMLFGAINYYNQGFYFEGEILYFTYLENSLN